MNIGSDIELVSSLPMDRGLSRHLDADDYARLSKRVVRKLDLLLLPFLCLLFLLNSLDKSNVGNAESGHFTQIRFERIRGLVLCCFRLLSAHRCLLWSQVWYGKMGPCHYESLGSLHRSSYRCTVSDSTGDPESAHRSTRIWILSYHG
jgi:hypothetical protein